MEIAAVTQPTQGHYSCIFLFFDSFPPFILWKQHCGKAAINSCDGPLVKRKKTDECLIYPSACSERVNPFFFFLIDQLLWYFSAASVWRCMQNNFPTQQPSMKWLSNANAWRAMDAALIMPALFLHVQRRRGAGGRMKGEWERGRRGREGWWRGRWERERVRGSRRIKKRSEKCPRKRELA